MRTSPFYQKLTKQHELKTEKSLAISWFGGTPPRPVSERRLWSPTDGVCGWELGSSDGALAQRLPQGGNEVSRKRFWMAT